MPGNRRDGHTDAWRDGVCNQTIKSDNSFEVELVTGDTKGLTGIYDHEATVFDPLNRQFTSVQGQAHIIAKKDPGD